jgi:hypothetical protein
MHQLSLSLSFLSCFRSALLNDAVRMQGDIAWNRSANDELERVWQEAVEI